tara:strand:- start:2009 stop:2269 length:261 start_codon:yes stop_codon:yes gene_type:complete
MDIEKRKKLYVLHQSTRKHGVNRIFRKIAEFFDCKGPAPQKNKISVTELFLKIAEGEFDIINIETGQGFWNENGYLPKDKNKSDFE